MKFDNIFDTQLTEATSILERINQLSNLCGKNLSNIIKKGFNNADSFYETALQFNRLNSEAISSIQLLLRAGHIFESVVLLRWHLEIGHLFYYLANNKSQYEEWMKGKQIRPKVIGEYFENVGLATWYESYLDWSNFTHANYQVINSCHTISKMKPINKDDIIVLSRVLRDLMFTAQKVTFVIGPLLKSSLPLSENNRIARENNDLNELIIKYSDKHNQRESERMNT